MSPPLHTQGWLWPLFFLHAARCCLVFSADVELQVRIPRGTRAFLDGGSMFFLCPRESFLGILVLPPPVQRHLVAVHVGGYITPLVLGFIYVPAVSFAFCVSCPARSIKTVRSNSCFPSSTVRARPLERCASKTWRNSWMFTVLSAAKRSTC